MLRKHILPTHRFNQVPLSRTVGGRWERGEVPGGGPPRFRHIVHPMPAGIDFRRYRKVRRFVTRTFIQVVWWDMVLNVPGLRRFRRPPLVRYQGIARRYRALAA